MTATTTVKMIRNPNNSWPQPVQQNILRALEDIPAARDIVLKAFADSSTAEPSAAEVHPDEVENWAAQGWTRADAGASS